MKRNISSRNLFLSIRSGLKKPLVHLRQFFLPDKFYTSEYIDEKYKSNIGKYTYGYPQIIDWNDGGKLKIGKFCSIAGSVKILLGGNHRLEWATTYPFPSSPDFKKAAKFVKNQSVSRGDVVIGNDVLIGQDAFILSGVTVGDGAVIGARALVTHDVAPYSIVAGNPAKEIRKRFDQKTIEKLLKLRWWDWSEAKIRQNISLLCSENIKKLIEKNEK